MQGITGSSKPIGRQELNGEDQGPRNISVTTLHDLLTDSEAAKAAGKPGFYGVY